MSFGTILKQLRERSNMTQLQLAEIIGVSRSAIGMYEGDLREPDFETMEAIADYFNVTMDFLHGKEVEYASPRYPAPVITEDTVTFPVIGEAAAGFERIAVENWEGDTIEIPSAYLRGRPASDYIVLRVCGDSMYPFYLEGDMVLVLRTPTLDHSGQVGLVRYEGELATLKKVEYVDGEDWLRLIPLNAMYPPRTITGMDLEQCSVIGIPKLLIREIEE